MAFCELCGKEIEQGTRCDACAAAAAQPAAEPVAAYAGTEGSAAPTGAAPQFYPNLNTPPVAPAQPQVAWQTPVRVPLTQEQLPAEYKPLGAWAYFGYALLFAIPLVGFILLLVFSLSGTGNVNLRNYARSYFCGLLVVLILCAFVVGMMAAGLFSLSQLM